MQCVLDTTQQARPPLMPPCTPSSFSSVLVGHFNFVQSLNSQQLFFILFSRLGECHLNQAADPKCAIHAAPCRCQRSRHYKTEQHLILPLAPSLSQSGARLPHQGMIGRAFPTETRILEFYQLCRFLERLSCTGPAARISSHISREPMTISRAVA